MTIIRWCDAGLLDCVKTPGGHRRIALDQARTFLSERGLPIPDALAPPGLESRVLALVRQEAAQTVRSTIVGAAPVEVLHCPYATILSFVATPPRFLLVERRAEPDLERLFAALSGPRRLLDDVVTVVVGEPPGHAVGGLLLDFPPGALGQALRVLRELARHRGKPGVVRGK